MRNLWRSLGPELKPHTKRLVVVFLVGMLVSAVKAVVPEILGRLQQAWQMQDHDMAIRLPLVLTGVWIVAAAGRYYHVFWMRYISDVIAVNLRRQLMNKYLTLNLSFFQGFIRGSGGLISRMLNDITLIQTGLHKFADMAREPFMVVFAFGYLCYLDWRLTLFILVAAPIITSIMRSFARSVRKYTRQNQEISEELTQVLKESLDGTRIVQSFNLEPEMRRRFDELAQRYLKSVWKIYAREEASGPVSESLASLFISVVLIYIGLMTIRGELNIGDFMRFVAAITLLQDSLKKLQAGFMKLQISSVAMDRLHEILDSDSVVPQVANPSPFPKDWHDIEFRNVSFAYDSQPVLKNVNLKIRKGEIVALVGASGSGKSTLTNLLPRFFDPAAGDILIGGRSVKEMALHDLRQNVALVSQDVFLFSDSVERNIWSGDFSRPKEGIERAAKLANAHDFLMSTREGYSSRAGDRGSLFSGGEKQRISIARAIFKDAPILVLDEATSALDSESEQEVQKGLDHLLEGRTALVVAHRLSTISKADRIVVMRKGEVVEEGTHQDLLSRKGEYFRYYQLQAGM